MKVLKRKVENVVIYFKWASEFSQFSEFSEISEISQFSQGGTSSNKAGCRGGIPLCWF